MGLNTAASISFSQINSTSYFTNGNLGINTTNPTANLDVAGTIKASGLSSLASITTGDLSATNVSAGVINSTGLTTGNINFTGSLFQNGVAYVGSQWTTTSGNVSYTSGSVVATNLLATNVTYSNLVTPNVNLGVSSIFSGSFSASNNVVAPTDVTDFVFANANIRSFTANVSVSVVLSVGTSLYSIVTLYGNQNSNGWSLYTDTKGDNTGITFTITNTGQIQYTSTNQSNWTSTIFRYNAQQLSATGTYTSVLVNTQGSYIMSTVQLNDTTDAVAGVSNGPLYVLGGGTITKSLNVNGVVSTGGLSATNATATNISAGTLIASTGLTTGTINATGLSSLQNATATNVSTGTINVTGLSSLVNATVTNVSAGTLIASTGITAGTINATGLSSLQNATATNVSAGTINATELSTLTNATATNVSAGTLIASTGITTGTINATGLSSLQNTTATNISTGTLIATTSVTSGLLSATNIVGNSISAGTLSGTTITGANLSLSGNLVIGGTLTTVNITSTNMLNTNISAGTINATGLTSLQNVTLTNVSTATLSASTGITVASLRVTNENVTTSTIATLRVSSNLLALGNSNTIGNLFTNSGSVGIGTVSPSELLTVNGSMRLGPTTDSDTDYYIKCAGQLSISANDASSQNTIFTSLLLSSGVSPNQSIINLAGSSISKSISFLTSNTERMRIDASGNVGIGTASPGSSLHVAGSIPSSPAGAGVHMGIDPSGYAVMQLNSNVGSYIDFGVPGGDFTSRIFANAAGNIGIGTASPTATLDVNGAARIGGNVGFKVWTISGTHAASGSSTTFALPAGCSRASIISVTGVTYNSNGDVVPFNGLGAEWGVGYYIMSSNNSIYLGPGSSAASRSFIVTIMTNS